MEPMGIPNIDSSLYVMHKIITERVADRFVDDPDFHIAYVLKHNYWLEV